jgi:epsilon-lactone hydrolase
MNPLASPLFGDFTHLPPTRVHVGSDEMLRDDPLRYVERAIDAVADAAVDVWEGMVHGFQGQVEQSIAANAALKSTGAFLAAQLGINGAQSRS